MVVHFDDYWERKQLHQLIKLKHHTLFDFLDLANVPNLEDKIDMVFLSDSRSIKSWLEIRGFDYQKNISIKLIKGLSAALTQAPENMQIVFDSFQLPYKRFWRLVFAMRHIKNVQFSEWVIAQLAEINDQFHIDLFGNWKFAICFSNIISANDKILQTNKVERILKTLAIMKKVGSKDNKPIMLDFTHSDVNIEEIADFIESKSLEDVLEIHNQSFEW